MLNKRILIAQVFSSSTMQKVSEDMLHVCICMVSEHRPAASLGFKLSNTTRAPGSPMRHVPYVSPLKIAHIRVSNP